MPKSSTAVLEEMNADLEKSLNTSEDEDWWKKNAGLRIYALDNSPLLRLFMHPEEAAS